jgi:hypothetical protein
MQKSETYLETELSESNSDNEEEIKKIHIDWKKIFIPLDDDSSKEINEVKLNCPICGRCNCPYL